MWSDIRGWFDWEWLYDRAIAEIPDAGFIVEVGVCFGRSYGYLLDRAQHITEPCRPFIHGIDTFIVQDWMARDHQDVLGNLKEGDDFLPLTTRLLDEHLGEWWHDIGDLWNMSSIDAAKHFDSDEIHLVYIDGDHSTEAVTADIAAWWPKVGPGGMLAGHDYGNFGVEPAVRAAFGDKFEVRGSTWMVRK